MEYQCSNLFLMQHLSSISHQKIYPTVPIKIEMPLWKTLHITRLWNHAREQEIYLSQQQQKNDWWIHQMVDSHHTSLQSLENYLPPSWLDDTASTTPPTTIETTPTTTINSTALDLIHDDDEDEDDDDDDEEVDADATMISTTQSTDTAHTTTTTTTTTTTMDDVLTQNELEPLPAISTQDRKRKHEADPSISESSPTQPPATRATTPPPSSPMLKV